jgi:hypothetical protein
VHVSPSDLLSSEPPSKIRITRADKSRVVLHKPQLVGDTLLDGRSGHDLPAKVSLDEVAEVQVRRLDPVETAGLILGTAALGLLVAAGLTWDARAD